MGWEVPAQGAPVPAGLSQPQGNGVLQVGQWGQGHPSVLLSRAGLALPAEPDVATSGSPLLSVCRTGRGRSCWGQGRLGTQQHQGQQEGPSEPVQCPVTLVR